jgi:hypothetical protein
MYMAIFEVLLLKTWRGFYLVVMSLTPTLNTQFLCMLLLSVFVSKYA